jgi:hypothetical protein
MISIKNYYTNIEKKGLEINNFNPLGEIQLM